MKLRHAHLLFVLASIASAAPTHSFAAGIGGYARGLESSVERIVEGRYTLAPFASVVFCMKNKDQCADPGGADVVTLTEDRREEMLSVNSGINRAIAPRNDVGNDDSWNVDVAAGDCEDYALTKRKHLIALGWPARALRIAVATTRSGEGHAVLIVKTSDGDLVLDNRTPKIRDWTKTDLRWIKMQGINPQTWVEIDRTPRQFLTVSDRS
jgi:predicted transglutaminase-like cysteine proteinase